jgi:hypothetical protein
MKVRAGFVSNSSSASFIIQWKMPHGKPLSVDEAVDILFDERQCETTENIKRHTVPIDSQNNIYQSTFNIIMFNSCADFGEDALLLWTTLSFLDAQKFYRYTNGGLEKFYPELINGKIADHH